VVLANYISLTDFFTLNPGIITALNSLKIPTKTRCRS
jgi:hypothetical protein